MIWLNARASVSSQCDTLVHEWAHQLVPVRRVEHTREFWIAQGKVYQQFLEWLAAYRIDDPREEE